MGILQYTSSFNINNYIRNEPKDHLAAAQLAAVMEIWPPPASILDEAERVAWSVQQFNNSRDALSATEKERLDLIALRFLAQNFEDSAVAVLYGLYRIYERVMFIEDGDDQAAFREKIADVLPEQFANRLFKAHGSRLDGTPAYYAIINIFNAIATGLISLSDGVGMLSSEINLTAGKFSALAQETGLAVGGILKAVIQAPEDKVEAITERARVAISKIQNIHKEVADVGLHQSGPSGYRTRIHDIVAPFGDKRGKTFDVPMSVIKVDERIVNLPYPQPVINSAGEHVRVGGRLFNTEKYLVYEMRIPLLEGGELPNIKGLSNMITNIKNMV